MQRAERSGLHRNQISNMERDVGRGSRPPADPHPSTNYALARALDGAPDALLPRPSEPDPVRLWVDDLRPAPPGWMAVTTSADAIAALAAGRVVELSLDHDLGGEDTTRPIVLWMCENNIWPTRIHVHSANPVGVEWLTGMLDRYGPPPG